MYLSDRQLHARLADLDVESPEGDNSFDPAGQIQAASIDLRLSNVFWFPRRGATIDLLKEKAIQLQPYRFWTRRQFHRSQPIELKPGEIVLGRVHEKLTIPNDCAGKLMGRSSYARLGLVVHCTGDFANPGYRGHMPLQLVNVGPFTLRLYPYMQICQLALVKLTEASIKKYGGHDVASKYMNDDGGPSYWWRDKYIKQLQEALAAMDASEGIQRSVYSRLVDVDNDILERLGNFLSHHPKLGITTADELLTQFAEREQSLKRKHEYSIPLWWTISGVIAAIVITAFFTFDAALWIKIGSSAVFALAFGKALFVYYSPRPRTFLGFEEIKKIPNPPLG